jgi:muramoyltetrapeptide carboxypeptidase LdcA involved in peptidoglycan recycling
VAGFPIGHGTENATLPIGIQARLTTRPPRLSYLEAATAQLGFKGPRIRGFK